MNTYYKSKVYLANGLVDLIDQTWDGKISDIEMEKTLKLIYKNNRDHFYYNGKLAPVLQFNLGKQRIELINKVLGTNFKVNE
jgi:uncharacterized protein (TIGR04540 family)